MNPRRYQVVVYVFSLGYYMYGCYAEVIVELRALLFRRSSPHTALIPCYALDT